MIADIIYAMFIHVLKNYLDWGELMLDCSINSYWGFGYQRYGDIIDEWRMISYEMGWHTTPIRGCWPNLQLKPDSHLPKWDGMRVFLVAQVLWLWLAHNTEFDVSWYIVVQVYLKTITPTGFGIIFANLDSDEWLGHLLVHGMMLW